MHFAVDAPPAAHRGRRASSRRTSATTVASRARRGAADADDHVVGRFGARSRVQEGDVDRGRRRHARAALLRSRDGSRDLRHNPTERRPHEQVPHLLCSVCVAALVVGCTALASDGQRRVAARRRVSRQGLGDRHLDGPGAEDLPGRPRRVQEAVSRTSSVKYTSAGDNMPTVLSTAVAGGNPPDIAAIAQPGPRQGVRQRRARSSRSTSRRPTIAKNYTPVLDHARHGQRQALRPDLQGRQQVDRLVQRRRRSRTPASSRRRRGRSSSRPPRRSGPRARRAYSIGGADGWTLTDLFENIYLRQAGPAKYDQLTAHKIKWTDPSVKAALKTMAQILGDTGNISGGTSGALQTDFPTSVNNVFSDAAEGRDGDRGRLRPRRVATDEGEADHGLQRLPVPVDRRLAAGGRRRRRHRRHVQGHARRRARSSRTSRRPRRRRSGPSAAASRRRTRTCRRAPTRTPLTRTTATALAQGEDRSASTCPTSRRRRSAARPARASGRSSRTSSKNPTDVNGTASQLEAAAATAYKK